METASRYPVMLKVLSLTLTGCRSLVACGRPHIQFGFMYRDQPTRCNVAGLSLSRSTLKRSYLASRPALNITSVSSSTQPTRPFTRSNPFFRWLLCATLPAQPPDALLEKIGASSSSFPGSKAALTKEYTSLKTLGAKGILARLPHFCQFRYDPFADSGVTAAGDGDRSTACHPDSPIDFVGLC